MNVLLVAPQFDRSFWTLEQTCKVYGSRALTPPLGLITVASLLPKDWTCRLVDLQFEKLSKRAIDWADLVMTGGMLPQRLHTLGVIERVKRRGKPVVVGGPDPTSSPEEYATADLLVLGEAESIIDQFITAWNQGARKGRFEAEKFKADVTRTPLPRYDLINLKKYTFVGVQFARGCPFTCEFCDIIELYGRAPRVKLAQQMLAELDAVYALGHRGFVNFVDDNFIGNKKAVKVLLPELIDWQRRHGYPFWFATEASLNLAEDNDLLAMMGQANFQIVFMGIESPDKESLIAMKKKQNVRGPIEEAVARIHNAGIATMAGFIIGFDSERESVAEGMITCIERSAIPVCMVGLLYALAGTQLTRRLAREGRLIDEIMTERTLGGSGDQCVQGLNFRTLRPLREILLDYRRVVEAVYSPEAYFRRVRAMADLLRRPRLDRSLAEHLEMVPYLNIPRGDFAAFLRLIRALAWQPRALVHFLRLLIHAVKHNPDTVDSIAAMAAFYVHLGPYAKYVVNAIDKRIARAAEEEKRPVVAALEAA